LVRTTMVPAETDEGAATIVPCACAAFGANANEPMTAAANAADSKVVARICKIPVADPHHSAFHAGPAAGMDNNPRRAHAQ
jgi:hypothetical protein